METQSDCNTRPNASNTDGSGTGVRDDKSSFDE